MKPLTPQQRKLQLLLKIRNSAYVVLFLGLITILYSFVRGWTLDSNEAKMGLLKIMFLGEVVTIISMITLFWIGNIEESKN